MVVETQNENEKHMNEELNYLVAHYSPAQIYFLLGLKIVFLCIAIASVLWMRKIQR